MSGLVVDTSAFVKVLVREDGSDRTLAILDNADSLLAPANLLAESANVLWKKVRWQGYPRERANESFADMMRYEIELIPVEDLLPEAFALACELPHPVYDCLYLLLALHGGRTLVTADKQMREGAEALGVRVEWVGS